MEIKNTNSKDYKNFLELLESIGEEREFEIGEIITSYKYIPGEIFLIKDGNARLVTNLDDKLTSVGKLSKGDFIGIATI